MALISSKQKNISDKDLSDMITARDIPFIDMGDSVVTERNITRSGDIIDIVKNPGTSSFDIQVSGKESMRLEEAASAAKFAKTMREHPLLTLE